MEGQWDTEGLKNQAIHVTGFPIMFGLDFSGVRIPQRESVWRPWYLMAALVLRTDGEGANKRIKTPLTAFSPDTGRGGEVDITWGFFPLPGQNNPEGLFQ